MTRRFVAAALAAVSFSLPHGAEALPQAVHAHKATTAPKMDGGGSDASWDGSLMATSFIDFTTKSPSGAPTKVYFTYDDHSVYVAFQCEQPAVTVKTSANQNDLAAQSVDYVELQIDPSGNGSRVYRFDATPNGLRYQYSSESTRYDPRWSAMGRLESGAYAVTMAIPIAAMRVQGGDRQTWRLNFVRHVAGVSEDLTWAYDPGMTDVRFDSRYWITVSDINIGGARKPVPYADVFGLASGGEDRATYGTSGTAVHQPRVVGIDANIPVTGTAALVATVNPDFSNVDRDQFTIAPQEFALALREYRPFFAQGQYYVAPLPFAGISSTNVTPFYTPNIGIVDHGIKFEGTQGLSSFGVLNVDGAEYHDSVVGYNYTSRDQSTQIAFQDVMTHHIGSSDSTVGASVFQQNQKSGLYANAELIANRGGYVDAPSQANAALFAVGLHNSRWSVSAQYQDIGPEFAPQDGYVANNDIRGPFVAVDYNNSTAGHGLLKAYEFQVYGDRFVNRSGAVGEADSGFYAALKTKPLLNLYISSSTSELNEYAQAYPVYTGSFIAPYHLTTVSLGLRDGTPSPTDISYGWGNFTVSCAAQTFCGRGTSIFPTAFVQQPSFSFARPLGQVYSVGFLYAGTIEKTPFGADSQWLRRLSVSRAIGRRGSLNVALRTISGAGGYAVPGANLSVGLDMPIHDTDHLYLEYGSPSSVRTLNRFLFKYVFHVTGGRP